MAPLFDTSTRVTFGLASAALVATPGPGQALVLTRTSATAFAAVKYLGAGYLILLGVRALRTVGVAEPGARQDTSTPPGHLLAHAAMAGILNPKVAIFFLAFLPQFVDPARGRSFLQFMLLGLAFAGLGLLGDSLLALVAGRARGRLLAGSRAAQWRERITGTVLIGLGIRLALQSRR